MLYWPKCIVTRMPVIHMITSFSDNFCDSFVILQTLAKFAKISKVGKKGVKLFQLILCLSLQYQARIS